MDTTFPSEPHRKALLEQCTTRLGYDFSKLSPPDRWSLHAYDYAFRRTLLADFSGKSPIDQPGDWYSSTLAEQAERIYRPKRQNLSRIVL